ncbi:MAG: class I SAM-dependent rRNA methyltransferase [Christensenellaceae bacterium]|nr:class I SAM-dependent rRNA methyltransferase [Christensenellaceae bacterium]
MAQRVFPKISITEKAERSVRGGHPWVYSEEILCVDGSYENGDLVDVYTKKNRFLGTGYINDNSKIRIRIISRNANDRFDDDFYRRRIRYAIEYRKTVMGNDFDEGCCRIIFGESDSFPGLTVDRFNDVLVVQVLSLGIERIKHRLFPLFIEVFAEFGIKLRAIYERNDVAIRNKEGMEQCKGYYMHEGLSEIPDGKLIITENGIKYEINIITGQKTGFFLDQKYNRLAAARIAKGRNVLDCFTHTGAFALNAAKAGANHVTAVDISDDAVKLAKANAELNGLSERMSFVCADVFDLLTDMEARKKCEFDYIILDPPAFTKSRDTVRSAINGYKAINAKAMKLLPRGGYLATCSCSHFMTDDLFRRMLHDAAIDAGVQLRQIEGRQQSPDHPILWNVPETDYLKFYIFQIV